MKNGILMIGENRAKLSLFAEIPTAAPDAESEKALQNASLAWFEVKHGKASDNVPVPTGKLELTEDRYVYKNFRALSQVFLANRGLDFSRPGVLKAAVNLLKGRTVYANHDFRDIDNWRGVIADAFWDESGEQSEGVPGINARVKVDAFLNYRTACGLMMTPPAINAASVTILSEVEFSHPELVKNGTFWQKFLEEVDGSIVRLIATKIIAIWEMSLVWLGEDNLAQALPDDAENETTGDDEPLSRAKRTDKMAASEPAATFTEKKMKVKEEDKKLLGLAIEGDDVPEQTVLDAALALAKKQPMTATEVAELSLKAKQGEQLVAEKRHEVERLAKLAELGSEEGTLNDVISKMIGDATVEDLVSLESLYRGKVGAKFGAGRSSTENHKEVETAGGVAKPENKNQAVNLTGLH